MTKKSKGWEIVKAFYENKQIERSDLHSDNWQPHHDSVFDFGSYKYRIKPDLNDMKNLPIDTPILVRDYEHQGWVKAYFAGYEERNYPLAFIDGATSRTRPDKTVQWGDMKLDPDAKSLAYWLPNTGKCPDVAEGDLVIAKFSSGYYGAVTSPAHKDYAWSKSNSLPIEMYTVIEQVKVG